MKTPIQHSILTLLSLALFGAPLVAQSLDGSNLGFDDTPPAAGVPTGWDGRDALPASGGLGYVIDTVGEPTHSGRASARLRWEGPGRDDAPDFGALTQSVDAGPFRGRRVRLTGWLRGEAVESGAGLWMRVDGEGGLLAFDNMSDRFLRGDSGWQRFAVVHDIDARAERLAFGVLLTGRGTLWADELTLDIVDDEVETTTLISNEPFEDRPAGRHVVDWIAGRALPLQDIDSSKSAAKLLPFVRTVGARIIGIGEAAHGTHEQQLLRQQLMRALIEDRGADVIALDIDWASALYLDQWVRRGRGDPRAELAALSDWSWRYEEVLDLVVWLRTWNRGAGQDRRVRLAGIGGRRVAASLQLAVPFLERVGDDAAAELEAVLQPIAMAEGERHPAAPADLERAAFTVAHVLELFDTQRAVWSEQTSAKTWQRARHLVEVAGQAVALQQAHEQAPWVDARARADNVAWLLEQAGEDACIVVLAHNNSVALTGQLEYPTLGQELRKRHGDDYLAVGASFDRGVFQSRDGRSLELDTFEVPAAPPGSIGETLGRAHDGPLLLDLRATPPAGPVRTWLDQPHQLRSIHSWYSEHARDLFITPLRIEEHFDVLLHVPETTAATPLDTP